MYSVNLRSRRCCFCTVCREGIAGCGAWCTFTSRCWSVLILRCCFMARRLFGALVSSSCFFCFSGRNSGSFLKTNKQKHYCLRVVTDSLLLFPCAVAAFFCIIFRFYLLLFGFALFFFLLSRVHTCACVCASVCRCVCV